MKKIEDKFKQLLDNHSGWSSYVCFFFSIENRNIWKMELNRLFNKLVEKDDYNKSDKSEILSFLHSTTLLNKAKLTK